MTPHLTKIKHTVCGRHETETDLKQPMKIHAIHAIPKTISNGFTHVRMHIDHNKNDHIIHRSTSANALTPYARKRLPAAAEQTPPHVTTVLSLQRAKKTKPATAKHRQAQHPMYVASVRVNNRAHRLPTRFRSRLPPSAQQNEKSKSNTRLAEIPPVRACLFCVLPYHYQPIH